MYGPNITPGLIGLNRGKSIKYAKTPKKNILPYMAREGKWEEAMNTHARRMTIKYTRTHYHYRQNTPEKMVLDKHLEKNKSMPEQPWVRVSGFRVWGSGLRPNKKLQNPLSGGAALDSMNDELDGGRRQFLDADLWRAHQDCRDIWNGLPNSQPR